MFFLRITEFLAGFTGIAFLTNQWYIIKQEVQKLQFGL